ncbi:hypothetical protein [Actinophytocola oryzae]|uniref:Uncharacterized protein n=1 Tax=Actinophytocola oryzae TaxID=502181 RepID=A0A4R7VXQ0_9PSEU|nr:hypothetical protein [Actinophytocola oryzae]TDV54814.1 hypothetical protein CLV71_10354 [Actinophytocola oryzae]
MTVLELFTEPTFFFRTAEPDTLAEHEIRELLTDAREIRDGDRVIGLWAVEQVGGDHGCHFQLHLRLSSGVSDERWVRAYHDVVRALRNEREVVRLQQLVGEFDERGLRLCKELGLSEDGTLRNVVVHQGNRYGYVYFGHVAEPAR